ncbi:MAG: hypothetical protein JJ971_09120 [Balneolaceae bacterium]|nr:hypothetical protein [Balneolaceae bacterium]MBO6546596.1 hypothetical protein [Balneolaceae bacterium]MBO6648955.1 hypothetical protein [Balneolaceae bacterium]
MKKYIGFILLIIWSVQVMAQEITRKIDLAIPAGDTITVSVSAESKLKIELLNRIPGKTYSVFTRKEITTYDAFENPLDLSGLGIKVNEIMQNKALQWEAFFPEKIDDCSTLAIATNVLYDSQSEFELTAYKSALLKLIKEYEYRGGCAEERKQAEDIIASTSLKLNHFEIKPNEIHYVTIYRGDSDSTKKEWTYIFKAPRRGNWGIQYGLSFAANISKDDAYFTHVQDSTYTITKSKSNKIVDLIPTIYFVWTPQKALYKNWSLSLTAGVGVENDSPSLLLGGLLRYNQNLGIGFGLAGHTQQRLLSKYSAGQLVGEVLSEDQLHESVYRFNPFLSLVFRLDSNPFKSDE